MRIKDYITTALKESNLTSLEMSLILAYVLKKPREFVLTYTEYKIDSRQARKINSLIARRKRGEPLAYLLGEKEFYGLNFFVNKNVLIPRPETELIIEETIHATRDTQHATIVDVGTGSGCIIITLAILNQKFKDHEYIGLDISSKALTVAKKNSKFHKVDSKIKFLKSDLLSGITNLPGIVRSSKIIILANLPYLTPKQVRESPSIKYEPKSALIAGSGGLKYYRKLFKQIIKLKLDNYVAFCEIDHTQARNIKKLITKELPEAKTEIKKDLAGYDRLVIVKSK